MPGKYLLDTFSTQNDMKQGQALDIPSQLCIRVYKKCA
jgi:hypothetical protein